MVGTWRLAVNVGNGFVTILWTINSDGQYRLTTTNRCAKKDESGRVNISGGSWTLQSDAGRNVGGKYKLLDPDTVFVSNPGGSGIWLRVGKTPQVAGTLPQPAQPQPAVVASVAPELVGTWRIGIANGQGFAVFTWVVDPGGRYRLNARSAAKVFDETGTIECGDGRWRCQADGGKISNGTYRILD